MPEYRFPSKDQKKTNKKKSTPSAKARKEKRKDLQYTQEVKTKQ